MTETILTRHANRLAREYWSSKPVLTALLAGARFGCHGMVASDGRPWKMFASGEVFPAGSPPQSTELEKTTQEMVQRMSDRLPIELGANGAGHLELLTDDLFNVAFGQDCGGENDETVPVRSDWQLQVTFYGAFVTRPNTIIMHPPGPAEAYR